MPNFSAGSMRINLSLTRFEDLTVTTDDPIVELNPWQCEVISLGSSSIAMPELSFVNSGTTHQLHWSCAPIDAARRAALWLGLVTRNRLRIRVGYDLRQAQDLDLQLQPITFGHAAPSGALPSDGLSFRVVETDLRVRLAETQGLALVDEHASQDEALFTFQSDGSLLLGDSEALAPLRRKRAVTLEVAQADAPDSAQRVKLKLCVPRC